MSAKTQTYEPAEQSDLLLEAAPRSASGLPKRQLLATLGFAVVGATLLWLGGRTGRRTVIRTDKVTGLTADADPCNQYPFVSLDEVLHSNLGGQGPDSGAEGIVFQAKDYIPGHDPIDLLLVLNASAAYKAGHAKYNGIHGKYGLITLQAGNEAEFTFKVLDPTTKEPKRLTKQEFTFFDMDQSSDGNNQEYIEVKGTSQVWLTKNTEIQVTELGNGTKMFMSSQAGSGRDNPKDPLALTMQQKNRAVTMEFRDVSELKVTLGCTAGKYARYFMFVARPSLLCAQTLGHVESGEDDVVAVETTTTPAPNAGRSTASTTQGTQQVCLFVVPVVHFCVPRAWRFW